jgi:hypothetical protein
LYFVLSILGMFLSTVSYYLILDSHIFEEYLIILNNLQVRTIFEYIVFLYYIIYFIYLPSIVFKSRDDLNYFFKVFFIVFNVSLVFGVVDFYFSYTDSGFIGRHLYEHIAGKPVMVGARFHGFAGEPRDAFIFLALGLAFYNVRSLFEDRPQNRYYYLLIIVCMLLTYSASSYIGIMIFVCFFAIVLAANDGKKCFMFLLLSPLFFFAAYLFILESPRLMIHSGNLLNIIDVYRTKEIPSALVGQMPNIYPIFWIVDNIYEYNPIPLFFGGGLGSASLVNNLLGEGNQITTDNPHANIIRLISETGLIGLYVYIIAFYKPVSKLAKQILSNRQSFRLITLLLLILSVSLAHRSSAIFIFTGIIYFYLKVLGNEKMMVQFRSA